MATVESVRRALAPRTVQCVWMLRQVRTQLPLWPALPRAVARLSQKATHVYQHRPAPLASLRWVHTSHSRDEPSNRVPPQHFDDLQDRVAADKVWTVPNLLTASRIALSPVLGYWIVCGSAKLALGFYGIAAFSDWLDGAIARQWPSQRSIWGSVLDPLADKVLIIVSAGSLFWSGLLPATVAAVWVVKDALMIATAAETRYKSLQQRLGHTPSLKLYLDMKQPTMEVKPLMLGKINTTLQFGSVMLALFYAAWPDALASLPAGTMETVWDFTCVSAIATGVMYVRHRNRTLVTVTREDGSPQSTTK